MRKADQRKHHRAAALAAEGNPGDAERKRQEEEEAANPAFRSALERGIEEDDEVKAMNLKVGKALALTEVQKQLEYKRRRVLEEKEREAAWAAMAEQQRRDANRKQAQIERERRIRAERDARELSVQLREREGKRIEEQEERDLEGQRILDAARRREQELREAAKRKAEAGLLERAELLEANKRALALKARRAEQERLRDKEAELYMMQQVKAERIAEMRKVEEKHRRDRQFARMAGQQMKAADRRAEEDERRAKVHQASVIRRQRAEAARVREAKAAFDM
jgi:colicin import membrane protein